METIKIKINGTVRELPWPEGCPGFTRYVSPLIDGDRVYYCYKPSLGYCSPYSLNEINTCCRAANWFDRCVRLQGQDSDPSKITRLKDAAKAWDDAIPWPENS